MKTIDQIFAESPAGSLSDTDLLILQRAGVTMAATAAAIHAFASQTVAAADITDSTAIGQNLIKAISESAARAIIDAAATVHGHAITDISAYDATPGNEKLEVERLRLTADTAPTDVEAGDVWLTETDVRVGDRRIPTSPTTVWYLNADSSFELTQRNGVIVFDTTVETLDFLLVGIAGVGIGDELLIVNTGANDVNITADIDVELIGGTVVLTGAETARLVCIESTGVEQTWVVT